MSEHPAAGGARVSRRALVDIIRPAVAGSYGVTGFVPRSAVERLLGWLHLADPGIRVATRQGLAIDLDLTVAFGLPVAEVARQADSAVRYALRRAIGRDVDRLTIHVGGMRYAGEQPRSPSAGSSDPSASRETADDARPDDGPAADAVLTGPGGEVE
ncbi:MAG TPA: Asp23/Gls24 family envelope stress response protein [Candidatus Limnocylindrales bacterium]